MQSNYGLLAPHFPFTYGQGFFIDEKDRILYSPPHSKFHYLVTEEIAKKIGVIEQNLLSRSVMLYLFVLLPINILLIFLLWSPEITLFFAAYFDGFFSIKAIEIMEEILLPTVAAALMFVPYLLLSRIYRKPEVDQILNQSAALNLGVCPKFKNYFVNPKVTGSKCKIWIMVVLGIIILTILGLFCLLFGIASQTHFIGDRIGAIIGGILFLCLAIVLPKIISKQKKATKAVRIYKGSGLSL